MDRIPKSRRRLGELVFLSQIKPTVIHYRQVPSLSGPEPLIWKLLCVAEEAWRHLKGAELLQEVYDGQHFADGVKVATKRKAAA